MLPSQTSASQAGLLLGSNDGIPAFRWYEKENRRLMVSNHGKDAEEIERRLSTGNGLLADGGASIDNMFSGDAPITRLTMSKVGTDQDQAGRTRSIYYFLLDPYSLGRMLVAHHRRGAQGVLPGLAAVAPRGGAAHAPRRHLPVAAGRDQRHPARPEHGPGQRADAARHAVDLRRLPGLRRDRAPLRTGADRGASTPWRGSTAPWAAWSGWPPTARGRIGSSSSPTTARAWAPPSGSATGRRWRS